MTQFAAVAYFLERPRRPTKGGAARVNGFPRLQSYIVGLPEGLSSYPDCQARTSLYLNLVENLPAPRPRTDQIPQPLAGMLARRPSSLWLPEVHVMATSLIIADHYGFDDSAYLRWVHQCNSGYFRSLVLRVLMTFLAPGELVTRAGARWSAIHRGSTLSAEPIPGGARVQLDFPPGVFSHPLLLEHFNAIWSAILEHARVREQEVSLHEWSDTRAVYVVRWR